MTLFVAFGIKRLPPRKSFRLFGLFGLFGYVKKISDLLQFATNRKTERRNFPMVKILIELFNHHFTLFFVFPSIVIAGMYLTVKLKCLQITHLKHSLSVLLGKEDGKEGSISRFGAITSILAGNFGTGNISGMAVAIATGGPGALIWMWVMAFFGAIIQYASCVLGVKYRHKTSSGEYVGGPMYYLRDGLGMKKTASLFAIFTIFGAITVGNFAQINSVTLPLHKMGLDPLYCSLAITALVGVVLLGGIQRIAWFASFIVPFMALMYLGCACLVLALNSAKILPALKTMCDHAFGFSSVLGGTLGAGVFKAMTTGFDRGIFATDAGTGIVPIIQSSTRSKHPASDGMATLLTPFLVMLICMTTGLVLMVTGAWQIPGLQSTNMVTYAFSQGIQSSLGGHIVTAALFLFAYTTILAWAYCGEKALGFLIGAEKGRWFRIAFIALIPLSNIMQVNIIWSLSDAAIILMLMANLVGIMRLSTQVFSSTEEFRLASRL